MKMVKTNSTYKNLINYLVRCKDKLKQATIAEQCEIIEEIYLRIKIDSLILFSDSSSKYQKVFELLFECEKMLTIPQFSINHQSLKKVSRITSSDDILNYVAYLVKNRLLKDRNDCLTGKCYIISHDVYYECRNLGVKCRIIKIDPGFSFEGDLYHGKGFHYFNIIEINGENYIMDLSYKQFFKGNAFNLLSRLGVVNTVPCLPGVYMTLDDERFALAQSILERGWVKVEKNTLKNYLDGFALSYRNGLYYEKQGEVRFETPYTDEDYNNFLLGKDNQFNHEPRECLGYQRRPLKNPYMRFNIK